MKSVDLFCSIVSKKLLEEHIPNSGNVAVVSKYRPIIKKIIWDEDGQYPMIKRNIEELHDAEVDIDDAVEELSQTVANYLDGIIHG